MQPQRHQYRSERGENQARDELDVAYSIVGPTEYDELLQLVNLGTGYYEDEDLRLQMRSFRKGLLASVAFDGPLWERAVYETKIKLADEGFSYYNEQAGDVRSWKPFDDLSEDERTDIFDDDREHGRTALLRARGDNIWSDLSRPEQTLSEYQASALAEKASLQAFKPVYWRLLAAYHEASKSRGGRTQDNFFGRRKEHLVESENPNEAAGILRRSKKS